MMETRKLHITVPRELYEYMRENKCFSGIDGVVTRLLMEYFEIE